METFWEKLKNWLKKPKIPKEGIDYEFYDFPDSDLTGIHLLRGVYRGVIYFYMGARFSEDDGYPRLFFEYEICQTGNLTREELTSDKKFDILIGDILTELMVNNAARADNPKKSYLQR